jgi:hypothetical protein
MKKEAIPVKAAGSLQCLHRMPLDYTNLARKDKMKL